MAKRKDSRGGIEKHRSWSSNQFGRSANMMLQMQDYDFYPEAIMPAPYVNVTGPGDHNITPIFAISKNYQSVNRYTNSPLYSFPISDYANKDDTRFGQSPTR
jgi:hypothetical protein